MNPSSVAEEEQEGGFSVTEPNEEESEQCYDTAGEKNKEFSSGFDEPNLEESTRYAEDGEEDPGCSESNDDGSAAVKSLDRVGCVKEVVFTTSNFSTAMFIPDVGKGEDDDDFEYEYAC